MVLSSSPIKIWDKSAMGFLSSDRAYKQTNKDYYFIYIDLYINIFPILESMGSTLIINQFFSEYISSSCF